MARWFLLLAALFSSVATASVPRASAVWESNPPAAALLAVDGVTPLEPAHFHPTLELAAGEPAERLQLFEPGGTTLVEADEHASFHPLQGVELIDTESRRGPPVSYPETRVWVIEVLGTTFVGEASGLSVELRPACSAFSCGVVSGNGKDPLGLMEMTPQAKRDLALMTADLARYRQAQSGAVIPSLRVRTVDRLTIGGDDLPEVTRQGYELSEAPEEVMHGMATSGTVQVSLDGSVSRATRVDSFVDAWDRAKPLDHVYYDEGSERFLLWSREEWQKQVDEQVQFSWKQNAATAIAAKFTASGAARARKNKGSSGKGTSGGTGYLRGGMIDENYEPNRKAVIKRDPSCQYCQTRPSTTADHVVPVYDADAVVGAGLMTREQARAAVNELENLLGACLSCNSSKKNSLPGNVPGTWQPSNPSPRAIEVMKQLGSWQ